MTFGFFKCKRKEGDRILSEIIKIKRQKNFCNYFIKIVRFHLSLSLRSKINKDRKRKKYTL